jgi:pyruvate dehydrogenase E1 component alpha subunit
MFETLALTDKEYLSLLDPDGNLNNITPQLPLLSDQELLSAYRLMLLTRKADEWAVSLNRQGRMATYPPNKGQEANAVGAVLAMREDDWLVPAFREMGALIAKGIPLQQVYM